jgi:hypothetical protein
MHLSFVENEKMPYNELQHRQTLKELLKNRLVNKRTKLGTHIACLNREPPSNGNYAMVVLRGYKKTITHC